MIDWWAFYGITAFILFVGFINGFWIGWLVGARLKKISERERNLDNG
jgi:hypothetical protein